MTLAALGAWLVFEDEAGFSMTPPATRTWAPRGHTPVVRVRGRSRRRLSVAALACYKPGKRSRLIYRPCPDARPDGRKSFSWKDYRDLVQTAHQQLGGPMVLVWGILNTHLTAGMHRYIAERDWLTVYQLPPYAPDLNPVEGLIITGGFINGSWCYANAGTVDLDTYVDSISTGNNAVQLYLSDGTFMSFLPNTYTPLGFPGYLVLRLQIL